MYIVYCPAKLRAHVNSLFSSGTVWIYRVAMSLPGSSPGGATADLSDGAQYSLLQTVVEACQKKRQCKFQTSPKTFGGDPCPGVRKYVEVAYKCRPCEYCLVRVAFEISYRKYEF